MINVYEKYKKDFLTLSGLFFVFVLYCIVFWGRAGDTMIDCPRELYLPLQISEGKNLYTQIFSLYPPLGYLLNAFFVKIFGQSLTLFYLLGMFNTWIILTFVYLLSRLFSKELMSFSVSILVLCYCVISYSPTTNFLFPYSYSMLYALTCFLISIYLLILYFKLDFKTKFILLSVLFAGLSVAFKTEFLPALLPVFFVLFIKEKSIKTKFVGIFLFLIPSILPFLWNLEGINIFINNFLGFCTSPASKEFLKTLSIKTPKEYITSTIIDFLLFSLLFAPLTLAMKSDTKAKKLTFFSAFLIYGYLITNYIYYHKIYIFSWLTLIAIWYFFKYWLKEKSDENFLYITLSAILVLSSFRVGGYLASNHYGKYILPLFFVVFFGCYFFPIIKSFCPPYAGEKVEKSDYEKWCSFILLVFSLYSVFFFGKAVFEGKNYKIVSGKNVIYATRPVGITIEQTARYIKENSSPSDRVLVLPEGLLVNYLAQRKSEDMFYQLLPNHIEILGEENIVEQMMKNPPEFVVLSSLSTRAYGKAYFGIDYAQKVYEFINQNYLYLETFSNREENRSFMMMVFRYNHQA